LCISTAIRITKFCTRGGLIVDEQKEVKIITAYLMIAMSEHISAAVQQAAVTTKVPEPPQHGLTNHNLQNAHHGSSQARENDPEQNSQAHKHGHTPQTHQHSEMDMAAFHDQMMALAHENTPESSKEAYGIAELLLECAELPLAFRVRAHIVLACGKNCLSSPRTGGRTLR
jgi:hypothetical protein